MTTQYNANGVFVGDGIIRADGVAFAARSVSSVTVQHLNGAGGCLTVVGFALLLGCLFIPFQSEYTWASRAINVAVSLVLGIGLIWWSRKPGGHYTVVLQVDGSEERILSTKDARVADEVREAIVRAIKLA